MSVSPCQAATIAGSIALVEEDALDDASRFLRETPRSISRS